MKGKYKFQNPFVQHLLKKKAGVHGKPYKTNRRDDKAALKKEIKCNES